jgi:hypothetical protein
MIGPLNHRKLLQRIRLQTGHDQPVWTDRDLEPQSWLGEMRPRQQLEHLACVACRLNGIRQRIGVGGRRQLDWHCVNLSPN